MDSKTESVTDWNPSIGILANCSFLRQYTVSPNITEYALFSKYLKHPHLSPMSFHPVPPAPKYPRIPKYPILKHPPQSDASAHPVPPPNIPEYPNIHL